MTIINLQISETDTINNKNQTTGIQVERIMQNMMRKCKAKRHIQPNSYIKVYIPITSCSQNVVH